MRKSVQAELPTEDGGTRQSAPALLREASDSMVDHRANPVRNLESREGRERDVGQPSLRDEESHDLVQEQRIPLGLLVDGGDESFVRLDAGALSNERRDFRPVEAGEREHARHRQSCEFAEGRRKGIVERWVDVAVGADDEKARVSELGCKELQQEERGRIRRVEVIEDEHERPGLSSVAEKLSNSLEEPETRRLRVDSDGPGGLRRDVSRLRHQLGEIRGAAPKLGAKRLRVEIADIRAKRLHPRPIGGRASSLPAAAPEHACLAGTRPRRELVGQAALADSGLTRDEKECTSPGERVVEPGHEGGELALAADEERALRERSDLVHGRACLGLPSEIELTNARTRRSSRPDPGRPGYTRNTGRYALQTKRDLTRKE